MPLCYDDIDAMLATLPGVTVGTKWNHRTWMVGDKGFAWERPLSKADVRRFGDEAPPQGELLAVRVEDLDAKDALLAIGLPGFFTIEHFNGYPAILIALKRARVKDVRAAVLDAFRSVGAAASKTKVAKTKVAKTKVAKTKVRARARRDG